MSAKKSPDNSLIKRVGNAGKLIKSYIVMHNGVKIYANSYYGTGMFNLLIANKGVHEPKEERIFDHIINSMDENCIMLELGSYWGFYSLSLLQKKPKAKCHLIEPLSDNLYCGKLNFKLNNRKGNFSSYYIDKVSNRKKNTISIGRLL